MDLKLTHAQGNQILQYLATGARMPEKLGKEEFDAMQRSLADDEMRQARSLLVSHSEMWALKRKVLFGKAANWKEGTDQKGQEVWNLIEAEAEVTVKPTEDQERGLFWILLLMAHPTSPIKVGIEGMNDVVWPIAEQLGYRNDLREMTGLNQRKPVRQLKRDSDPSWSKKSDNRKVDLDSKPAVTDGPAPR